MEPLDFFVITLVSFIVGCAVSYLMLYSIVKDLKKEAKELREDIEDMITIFSVVQNHETMKEISDFLKKGKQEDGMDDCNEFIYNPTDDEHITQAG